MSAPPPVQPPTTDREAGEGARWRLYAPLVLLAVTLAAFWPVVGANFVVWDDNYWLGENPALSPHPSWGGLMRLWGEPFRELYVPVTHTVWYVAGLMSERTNPGFRQFPFDPRPFHLMNLAGHLATVVFAYLLIRRVVPGRASWALAGAGVVALHPVVVEPVAWVSGLKDVLGGMFTAMGLWAFVKWTSDGREGEGGGTAVEGARGGVGWDGLEPVSGGALPSVATAFGGGFDAGAKTDERGSGDGRGVGTGVGVVWWGGWMRWVFVVPVVLALLSKPASVTFFVSAAALAGMGLGVSWRRWVVPVAVAALMAVPVAWVTRQAQPGTFGERYPSVVMRPLVATDALGWYVRTVVAPVGLTVDYGRPARWVVEEGRWVVNTLVVLAVLGGLVWLRDRVVWAGAGVFVAGVLPVLGLANFAFAGVSVVSDHYLYPSMLGAGIVAARLVSRAAKRWPDAARGIASACVVVGCVWGGMTFRQAGTWRDSHALYAHGVKVSPEAKTIRANLATVLYEREDFVGAYEQAKEAVRIWPEYPQANVLLGYLEAYRGAWQTALDHYIVAAKGDRSIGKNADYQAAVGDAYLGLGRADRAAQHYSEALRLKGDHAKAARGLTRARAALTATRATTEPTTSP